MKHIKKKPIHFKIQECCISQLEKRLLEDILDNSIVQLLFLSVLPADAKETAL